MNDAGTKRLALIKSLVREQGADGDKCWLIVQLETEAQENGRLRDEVTRTKDNALDMQRFQQGKVEAAEAIYKSLTEQSSRWEAQALEAGGRIAELEAQVRELREAARDLVRTWDDDHPPDDRCFCMAQAPDDMIAPPPCSLCRLRELFARVDKALAGEPGERSYSAEEVREAFAAGIRYYCLKGGVGAADEALRRYPEKPQEVKP